MWRAQDEQARPVLDGLRGEQRRLEGVAVVGDLAEVLDVPAVGREPLGDVVGVASSVAPSIVMWLSSKTQISRPSPRWPASEAASWLTPSIKQPSPAITHVWWSTSAGAEAVAQEALGDRHADGVARSPGRAGRW